MKKFINKINHKTKHTIVHDASSVVVIWSDTAEFDPNAASSVASGSLLGPWDPAVPEFLTRSGPADLDLPHHSALSELETAATQHETFSPTSIRNDPFTQPLTGQDVLRVVIDHVIQHFKTKEVAGSRITEKAVARQVVTFLTVKYDLTTDVVLDKLLFGEVNEIDAESTKLKSQLAVATQRAAALFALQANLLQSSLNELREHIIITQQSFKAMGFSDVSAFSTTFQQQEKDLEDELQQAKIKQREAQQRFQTLRELATAPIMQQLVVAITDYSKYYREIDPGPIENEVAKAMTIVPQLDGNIRQPLEATSSFDPRSAEFLKVLYMKAVDARKRLQSLLNELHGKCRDRNFDVEVEMGGLKAIERAMEKTVEEYDGDFSRLVDLARGSLVCSSADTAAVVIAVLREVAQDPANGIEIMRIKNRLDRKFPATAESGGYRDVLLNLRFNQVHICEVQIQLRGFMEIKTGGGHKVYSVARSLHLLDPALGVVRVSTNSETGAEVHVRDEFRRATQQVKNGTCQSLFLNHFKLTLAECNELKLALQSDSCILREIYMAHCGIDRQKGEALVGGVTGCVGSLRTVDLLGNPGITGQCVKALISEELEWLNIDQCSMNESDGNIIERAIVEINPFRLREILARGNQFGSNWGNSFSKRVQVGLSSASLSGDTQLDPELQLMLMMAIVSHSSQTIESLCQQGAHPLAKTSNISKLPIVVCQEKHFPAGIECMLKKFAFPAMDLTRLNEMHLSEEVKGSVYRGLSQLFTSSHCAVRKVETSGPHQLDYSKIENFLGTTELAIHHPTFDTQCLATLIYSCRDSPVASTLRVLDLSGCQIQREGLVELSSTPKLNLVLETLCVASCGIWNLDAETKISFPSLTSLDMAGNRLSQLDVSGLNQLTKLNVSGNDLGANGESFFRQLSGLPNLVEILIAKNSLGAEAISSPLGNLKRLTSLNLGYNGFGAEGAIAIAPSLVELKALTSLNLEHNDFRADGVKSIAPSLGELKALLSVDLSHNGFGTEGANAIAPSLGELKALASLNLSGNGLGAGGAKAIAPSLGELKALTSLNLGMNYLGAEGATAIAAVLGELKALTSLNLESNYLRSDGATAIKSSLSELKALVSLSFGGNGFGPEGAEAIAPSLGELKALTSLSLEKNGFGAKGTESIAPSLGELKALTSLNLGYNGLGTSAGAGAKSIATSLDRLKALTLLNLEHNGLGAEVAEGAKAIAPSIGELKALTSLNLGHNGLGEEGAKVIAPLIGELKALTSLDLGDNGIGAEGAKAVALSLGELKAMTTLNLERNALGIVGAQIITPLLGELLALTSINLGENGIGAAGAQAIAPSLGELQGLTSLNLGGNRLEAEGAIAIAPLLCELRALTSLDLGVNELGVEGAKAIVPLLNGLKALTSLNLHNNDLGAKGTKAIVASLGKLKALTFLNLSNNELKVDGTKIIAPSLGELKALFSLNLAENGLKTEGANAIAPSLRELKTLTLLNLFGNGLGTEGAAGAWAIAPSLGELKALTSLNFGYNGLGVKGAKAIAPSLGELKELTSLNLADNAFGAEGAKTIALSLGELKALTSLDLSMNKFGTKGAKSISLALGVMKALTLLNLENNGLGAEGAKLITSSLRELKGLASLNLGYNDLRPAGATVIALSLGELKAMTSLDLHSNFLGAKGAKDIAPSLSELKSLTSLNLDYNHLGAEGATALVPSLSQLKALTSLSLENNDLRAKGAKAIEPLFNELKALTSLNLVGNDLRDSGADAILYSLSELKALTSLNLDNNGIGEEGTHAIESLREAKALTSLNLENNDFPDEMKKNLTLQFVFVKDLRL